VAADAAVQVAEARLSQANVELEEVVEGQECTAGRLRALEDFARLVLETFIYTNGIFNGILCSICVYNGESPYKTCLYGSFLNLYGGGQANSILTTGITVPQQH
jgi:hypothetical protein